MTKHYMIKDLQTGEFSSFTEVQDIFEVMADDYLTNAWSPEEEEKIEAEFGTYTDDEKIHFVTMTYEYEFNEPSVDLVRAWEQDTGYDWEEKTGIKIGGLKDKHIIKLKDIANELDIILMDLNSLGMEAFPEFESKGAQAIEDVYKGIRDRMDELNDFIEENN
jgi:hypothetical protein